MEQAGKGREIALQLARDDAPPLDDRLIAELEESFPGLEAVGNHKVVVSVEGPYGSDLLTLQTLAPGDPRLDLLQVTPELRRDLGLTEVVVSDALGRLLYGEAWDSYWRDGLFTGPPLALAIHDLPVSGELRVVARRRLPGRGLYASPAAGAALRRHAQGLGALELVLAAGAGMAPARAGIEYDEVLAYVPRVERVEAVSRKLRARYPGYDVRYDEAALGELARQESRLSTLFLLALALAVFCLVPVLGALVRLHVEHHRRQPAGLAQRRIVAEHLLLTAAAAAVTCTLTALLCAAARHLLADGAAGGELESLVQSMGIDPAAFFQVFAVVALATALTAGFSARRAIRKGPSRPLD